MIERTQLFVEICCDMAKTHLVMLVSSAGTGCYYVKKKNVNYKQKLSFKKFDKKLRKRVLFVEKKMPKSSA